MPVVERKRADGSMAYLAQIDIIRKGERYRENRTVDKKRHTEQWIKSRSKDIRELVENGQGHELKMKGRRCTHPAPGSADPARRWMSRPGKWTHPKKLPKGRSWAELKAEFELGVDIFTACWHAPIPCRAIENPTMNDLARDRMLERICLRPISSSPSSSAIPPTRQPAGISMGFHRCGKRTACQSRNDCPPNGSAGTMCIACH